MDFLRHVGLDLTYSSHIMCIGLTMARIVPCVILAPFLGGKSTPAEIKMALILLLTIVVYPLVYRTLPGPIPDQPMAYMAIMLREIFIGLTMGLVTNHVFYAIEMMGRIIDTARGSNMAEVMVPQMEGRATPLGDLFYQYAICLVFALGGHRVYIDSVARSFEIFPLLSPINWGSSSVFAYFDMVMRIGGDILLIALGMALPAIGATFIVDCVFGLLNRVAPQLNAYFMAMPVKAMGGLALVFISSSMMSGRIEVAIAMMLDEVTRAIELIRL